MERALTLIFILYTLISALSDLRTRHISLRLSLVTALIGILCLPMAGGDIGAIALSMLPGICIMLISYLCSQAVGVGDGVFMIVTGIYMGLKDALLVLIYAWLGAGAIGLVCITLAGMSGRSRQQKNIGLPFVTAMALVIIIIKTGVLNV